MKENSLKTLNLVAQALYDKKSFNILALDVRNISTLTDFFIIAEGNVNKHVSSLGKAVIEQLRKEGRTPAHAEGLDQGDWVVIDYIDVVIHIFMPGMRDRYRLEELWKEGKIVDLEMVTSKVN